MNYNIVLAIDDSSRGYLIEILDENEFLEKHREEICNDLQECRFIKTKPGLYVTNCTLDKEYDEGFLFDELEPIFTVEEWRNKS
jgi:hypothetical protein